VVIKNQEDWDAFKSGKPRPTRVPTNTRTIAIAALILALILPVALYIVAPWAYNNTVTLNSKVIGLRGREERYITTVNTVIVAPTSLAGVPLQFVYFYKKDEGRVRAVVILPVGYSQDAANTPSDSTTVDAIGVLPLWAITVDPLSDGVLASFSITTVGYYGTSSGATGLVSAMFLTNGNHDGIQGLWAFQAVDGTIFDSTVFLGVDSCGIRYNATYCFSDFIGEFIFRLFTPVDLAAWGAQYDAAAW
jgi:hypothetical protein